MVRKCFINMNIKIFLQSYVSHRNSKYWSRGVFLLSKEDFHGYLKFTCRIPVIIVSKDMYPENDRPILPHCGSSDCSSSSHSWPFVSFFCSETRYCSAVSPLALAESPYFTQMRKSGDDSILANSFLLL